MKKESEGSKVLVEEARAQRRVRKESEGSKACLKGSEGSKARSKRK
jgi:hypothetical protein